MLLSVDDTINGCMGGDYGMVISVGGSDVGVR